MLNLLKSTVLHIFRSRLLMFVLAFSIFVQVVGLKFLGSMTISFQGETALIGARQAFFAALFFQLFVGFFISAVYGIWMVPYAHQGSRSTLTYVLPVSKWYFPVVYSAAFVLLLALQYMVMFAGLGFVYGWAIYTSEKLALDAIALCLLIQAIAFITCMIGFAVASLSFGQIATFFLGTAFLFVTQLIGTVSRFAQQYSALGQMPGVPDVSSTWTTIRQIYGFLPPLGELVFDMREAFKGEFTAFGHWYLWGVWFVIFALLFRWKLRYPSSSRSGEV